MSSFADAMIRVADVSYGGGPGTTMKDGMELDADCESLRGAPMGTRHARVHRLIAAEGGSALPRCFGGLQWGWAGQFRCFRAW